MDFTDLNPTAYGGSSIPAHTTRRHGLFELLADAVRVQGPQPRRDGRGDAVGDDRVPVVGDGALSDLDALRADAVARTLLGLRNVPEARRAGEWLARLGTRDVKGSGTRRGGSRSGCRR